MAEKVIERETRIAGRLFVLRSNEVRRALRHLEPEPIASHFVVVGDRRYPPKQVISAVTGLDRADFTTHQARRTLMRLGFAAGRRGTRREADPSSSSGPARGEDRWHTLAGQWVAIRGDDVLHASPTPRQLVTWLNEHGQRADRMFRVPEDELSAAGLAPL